jgi:hypothetical protein
MKKIGSQIRVTLKEAGYTFIRPNNGEPAEMWYANNHHAGYTIQIGRWGYEFGMTCKQIR